MRRYLVICMLLCFMAGCTTHQDIDPAMQEYNQIEENIRKYKTYDEQFPFEINLIFNQIENEWRYDLVIDNPDVNMYDIKVLSYCQSQKDQICPSIGIFDEEVYNLKPNYISKNEGYYKGIQLSGITSDKENVYVYVCYYADENYQEKIEKYIEVKPSETR